MATSMSLIPAIIASRSSTATANSFVTGAKQVPQPVNETQLEALVQRLGDEGARAVSDSLRLVIAEGDLAAADVGN